MTRLACAALPLWLLAPAVAHADVIAPEEEACSAGAEGDACKLDNGVEGKCTKAKCHRNDYSDGPPPKSISVDCLKCIETSEGAAADAADSPTPADRAEGDDEADVPAEVKADPPEAKADASPEKTEAKTEAEPEANAKGGTKDGTKDDTKDDKAGCTAGAPVSMTSVALGLVILFALGRSRRAR